MHFHGVMCTGCKTLASKRYKRFVAMLVKSAAEIAALPPSVNLNIWYAPPVGSF